MSDGRSTHRSTGRSSRREWGWHCLTDPWGCRVVEAASVCPGELVVDLGAGTGAIVGPLLTAGPRVVAVELHAGRVGVLRRRWPDALASRQLVVVCGDALSVGLPRQRFVVVANPPYAIGAAVIRRLLAPHSRLDRGYVVLPLQVARRLAAGDAPGAPRWERSYRLDVGLRLPRSAFHPRPQLDSALLVITRR